LIFTLIRIAATYTVPRPAPTKKEFSPEFELLLFEEPEAFLHPPQQNELDTSLRKLAFQPERQVVAATHSPLFVSYNCDDISDLSHIRKENAMTEVGQVVRPRLREIFEDNQAIGRILETAGCTPVEQDIELEEVRHFLWLNPERCSMFFADRVLITEGLSEQVAANYLLKTGQIDSGKTGVFVLETWGKYNIHRFMNLLGEMEIEHSVLHDLDDDKTGKEKVKQDGLNELIQQSRNRFTVAVDTIPMNLEAYLGVSHGQNERWNKAAKTLLMIKRGEIAEQKLAAFRDKIKKLVS
jgi:putative ATP-dependent endonuclease of OLD family